ncbi:HAD family hydrolase [Anaerostipes sp.]|uniref:HAD family hydrolase n=1 Tax=Anaerostipes sp. TaxID=1872530 RepID=UPI003FEECC89
MYRMIVSDLDGTLLNSEKHISDKNKIAIENFCKQGGMFVMATGRSDVMTKPYVEALKDVKIVIGCDGAVIRNVRNEEILYEKGLPTDICKEAFKICKKYHLSYYVFTKDALVGDDRENERLKLHEEFNQTVSIEEQIPIRYVDDLGEYVKYHYVYKIVASHEKKEYLDKVAEVLKKKINADAVRSGKRVLAIKAKGVSKAAALAQLLKKLHISAGEVAAFGDEVNDIEMLQMVGMGVAMENADQIVKDSADDVTTTNDKDGVAKKLNAWCKKKEGV